MNPDREVVLRMVKAELAAYREVMSHTYEQRARTNGTAGGMQADLDNRRLSRLNACTPASGAVRFKQVRSPTLEGQFQGEKRHACCS